MSFASVQRPERPVRVTAVAAVAENGVIGADGEMPWDAIGEDLRRFRRETTGHPVVMGRVTYESIADRLGGPLPERVNVVVSRSRTYDPYQAVVQSGPAAALSYAAALDDEVYVAGGESIYRALLPACDRMLITEVPGEYEGDAFFPDWNPNTWREASRAEGDRVDFVEYARADPASPVERP